VIIGVTRYYNVEWKDGQGRAPRVARDNVEPADERATLMKFAAANKLTFRIAIEKDDAMFDYYGVLGHPHIVVIDRTGTIRMLRIGEKDENAKAIGDVLESLLGSAPGGASQN
jgi:AhpC/TSA family